MHNDVGTNIHFTQASTGFKMTSDVCIKGFGPCIDVYLVMTGFSFVVTSAEFTLQLAVEFYMRLWT